MGLKLALVGPNLALVGLNFVVGPHLASVALLGPKLASMVTGSDQCTVRLPLGPMLAPRVGSSTVVVS
jgi:hypothetical protein